METIKGAKTSTKLEGKNLDRIIIRLTFHHFSKKAEMLDSIKKSLDPDGVVCIMEKNKDYCTKEDDPCSKTMKLKNIKSHFQKNGFELMDETRIWNTGVLLKYKVKQN